MANDVPGRPAALPAIANGAVVTVGTFDGVHVGHRDLIKQLAECAAERGLPSLLVTFEPHPLAVVNASAAPALVTPGSERLEELAGLGLDYVVVLPFTANLAHYSASAFVEELLLARYHMRELFVGYDHGLGRGREGDVALLRALGERHRFPVNVVDAVIVNGAPVSSTQVRRAIVAGDLTAAERFLGRRVSLRGTVVPGDQRGRTTGYPTLNLALPDGRKLLPPRGVYAVLVESARGGFGGMMNLGTRPTIGDDTLSIEVHVFDADGDWYGESVRVSVVSRLREVRRFEGLSALVAQLGKDERAARLALTQLEEWDTLRGSANNPPSFP